MRKPPLVVRRENGGGPLEERACGTGVTAVEGSAARRGEVLRCAAGEAGQLGGFRVELPAVAVRLLEVVAEDLVALDELLAVQPVRELLVQSCPRRLGQGLIGGIADQDVAKAEGLVAGKDAAVGTNELLAHQRRQMRFEV